MKPGYSFFASRLVSYVLCLLSVSVGAQSGSWIWVNGNDTINSFGNYGTKGTPSVNNSPPGAYTAAQWTDKQGNFWVFGGVKDALLQNNYSDLWKYDPGANTWEWVNGPGIPNQPGNYGALGVASLNNIPGARRWGSASWTDSIGDLWLFGGYGYDSMGNVGSLNDLWRYDIANNKWTWMSGRGMVNQLGVYGSLYQASTSFIPPPRDMANTAWTDNNNNLWLFGGSNYMGCFGDMWRYSIATGEWAWMGGNQSENYSGNYGVFGVESPANLPGARIGGAHWVDSNYLYLSCGSNSIPKTMYNDVWRFNLANNYWTWVGGDTGNVANGQYAHYCTTAYSDEPKGRYGDRSAQTNGCSPILFIWGGVEGIGGDTLLNDLWSFDLQARKWRWVSGYDSVSPHGNYGTEGVSAAVNMPPGATGSCLWSDNSGNLWLWGGWDLTGSGTNLTYASLNAMWKYIPDAACFPTGTGGGSLNYQLSATALCPGDSAVISFSGDSGVSISPVTGVTWIDSVHAVLRPDTTTTFAITGYTSCGGFDSISITLQVGAVGTVSITANKTAVCPGDSVLMCAPGGYASYSWSNGDTSTCISTPDAGSYYVTVAGNGNCTAVSNPVNISVYQPSPVTVSVNGDTLSGYSANGYQWFLNGVAISGATSSVYIAQASGTYTLQVIDTNGCRASSSPVVVTGITEESAANDISIYPNPSNGIWQMAVNPGLIGCWLEVFNATGQSVFKSEIRNHQSEINIPNAAPGIYELRITSGTGAYMKKLVKM